MSKEEKKLKIMHLYIEAQDDLVIKFFDLDSDKMLDEKIEVLEALNSGKDIKDIPNYYIVLENMPKDNQIWD